ncbi:SDR family NAD(P)-dependent oxidoreductase [Actinoplanes aureus]|uniref:SDR family NAD(P)-dependent oxidoreductase n=1 Tax=Actinoplanes aureus TaxID=2792083 RepID=A0A931G0W9_9ACTN|nr:SDR family NAD(P)-dependent oxidoreductase [Actinoplanes aureus]MBG0566142.1 SDR family NAD(P)-dependent oxidoreductase [Actinoplanes aureus]
MTRSVLVTGCSSGIGQAVAKRMHRGGFTVYATARRPETMAELSHLGIRTLPLDVTDDDSMRSAVSRVERDCGAVDVLVNNAGYGLAGTVEETPLTDVRAQFETNVLGTVRLTQLVLPGMRARGGGTVVNMASIFGRFAVAGGGFYHATKHAVEAVSQALRLEVRRFGVRVVVIEPGPVRTPFGSTYIGTLRQGDEVYGEFRHELVEYYEAIYHRTRRTLPSVLAVDPEQVARVVEKAVCSRRPRQRYPVGALTHGVFALRRLLPDAAFERFLRSEFPAP